MLGIVAALGLLTGPVVHAAPDSPYHWHMSCSRWMEKSREIEADRNLSENAKRFLVRYMRSKVDGPCTVA